MASVDGSDISSKKILLHSGMKPIIRENFMDLISALDKCNCPSSCSLPDDVHSLLALTIRAQQQAGTLISKEQTMSISRLTSTENDSCCSQMEDHVDNCQLARRLTKQLSKSFESISSGFTDDEDIDFELHVKKGYLLLMNNTWFDKNIFPRNGASEDAEKMRKLFEGFGFYVKCVSDMNSSEILDIIRYLAMSKDLDEYDCFACIMMSHGSEKGIIGTDNQPIELEKIMDFFKGDKCKSLIGKPKLFFFQSCRGDTVDHGNLLYRGGRHVLSDGIQSKGDTQTSHLVPTDSDILMLCATTKGRKANRQIVTEIGNYTASSWFIDAIAKVFPKYADREDVLAMMLRVNKQVAQQGDEFEVKQVPCQLSTLTMKVFFSTNHR